LARRLAFAAIFVPSIATTPTPDEPAAAHNRSTSTNNSPNACS
jgi:hypothetical protein